MGDVVGVALDGIVAVDLDPQALQPLLERVGGGLAGVPGDHYAAHVQAHGAEGVDQAEHIAVIGDAQVAPDLVFLDVAGVDGDDNLCLVLHFGKHPDLAVRLEPRQHPGSVEVVKQLAAELQVELAAELGDAVADMLGLKLKVHFVIKTDLGHESAP